MPQGTIRRAVQGSNVVSMGVREIVNAQNQRSGDYFTNRQIASMLGPVRGDAADRIEADRLSVERQMRYANLGEVA